MISMETRQAHIKLKATQLYNTTVTEIKQVVTKQILTVEQFNMTDMGIKPEVINKFHQGLYFLKNSSLVGFAKPIIKLI